MSGNSERSDKTAELQKRPTRGESMQRLVIILGVLVALAAATPATGAKPTKSARVQASADFIWVNVCGQGTQTGHIELDAYDDDTVMGPLATSPQADRISFRVTWADGRVWDEGTIAVAINGNEATIAWGSWWTVWTIHDGGKPGTATTGETLHGVPATVDWAFLHGPATSLCGRGMYFLTSGNIKVTPAS